MQQLEGIKHIPFPERVDHFNQLGDAQTENTAISSGFRPVASRFRRQLDADSDVRLDPQDFGTLNDQIEFTWHFNDKKTFEPHLHGIESEVDEFLVLVSVADEARILVLHLGQGGD